MASRKLRSAIAGAAGLILAVGLAPNVGSASATFAAGKRLICPANTPLCPRNVDRTEPAIRVDSTGQVWVTDQQGLPAGAALWRRAAGSPTFGWVDKFDQIPQVSSRGSALGGGDTDLTIGTDGTVYAASLWAGGITVASYTPAGQNIMRNYAGGGKTDIDRQWIASYGPKTLYMYHQEMFGPRGIWVSRSDDGGLTWLPPIAVQDTHGIFSARQVGNIIVDQRDGAVYALYEDGQGLWVGRCRPVILPGGVQAPSGCADASFPGGVRPTFENFLVQGMTWDPGTPGYQISTLFPIIAVDLAGNLYSIWSDAHSLWFSSSTDAGATWSPAVAASGSPGTSAVFPWIVAGSAGKVGIAYLGSGRANPEDPTGPPWYAYYTSSVNALAPTPTFETVQASDDPVHNSDVCLEGLSCGPIVAQWETAEQILENVLPEVFAGNRNLAEVVTLAIDTDGMVLVAYPDDYEGGISTYTRSVIAEQVDGPSLF